MHRQKARFVRAFWEYDEEEQCKPIQPRTGKKNPLRRQNA